MLEMKDVCLNKDGKQVFQSLSFMVREGDTLCVSGMRGSGKTTLLQTFMGLQRIDSGYVNTDGELITPRSAVYFRKNMAYLPQDLHLHGTTVAELFRTFASLHANKKQQLSKNKLLANCHLLDINGNIWNRTISEIDKSILQRLLLSLVTTPIRNIFLFDEPISEQGGEDVQRIKNYIARLKSETSIIVIATNDERIKGICNRHMVLEKRS